MIDNIKISIIVPCYNREKHIANTIKSLLNQTVNDYEIIIIDDGSNDKTYNILKKINSSKISLYRINNSERGKARNYGASKAKGDYFNFFDSDDIAKNIHIETAISSIKKLEKPEMLHQSYQYLDNNGKKKMIILDNNINSKIFSGNILSCNGVFIRNDIFFENQFSENRDLSGSEDWDLWLRLSLKYKIHSIKKITSTIIDHEDRSMKTQSFDKVLKRINILLSNVNNKKYMKTSNIQLLKINSELYSFLALNSSILTKKKFKTIYYLFISIINNPFTLLKKRFYYTVLKIFIL